MDRIEFLEVFAILRISGHISELEQELYNEKRAKILQIIEELEIDNKEKDKKDEYLKSLKEALLLRKPVELYELQYVQEKYNDFIRKHPVQIKDFHDEEPLNVLKMRLAKGEISLNEFNELKKVIEN